MPSAGGFAFGPFTLDLVQKRLRRDDVDVPLPTRHFDVLVELLTHPHEIVTRKALMDTVWSDVHVEDHNLTQAVSNLRRAFRGSDAADHIRTEPHRGYTFTGTWRTIPLRADEAALVASLAPFRALMEGRASLEQLVHPHFVRAQALFGDLIPRHPGHGGLHVGMANACALLFEFTRADAEPDVKVLERAVFHANEAWRMLPESGEVNATLGFVLWLTGDRENAIAAFRRAVAFEPDEWQHHVRHGFCAWGSPRLNAARQALSVWRACAMAYWLAASVFIARDMLERAEREIDEGLAIVARSTTAFGRFAAGPLYWLKGLLRLARGQEADAMLAFTQGLACEADGYLYGRECAASIWYAIGACYFRGGDAAAAHRAFSESIARVPKYPMAHAGLVLLDPTHPGGQTSTLPNAVDVAMARAAELAMTGQAPSAAQLMTTALSVAPEGNAGWLLPIDPLIGVARDRETWALALSKLAERAS